MIGEIVNGYRIIHKIGEGGMGEVYFAQDDMGQKTAIKIMRGEYRNRHDLKARFINEVRVMIDLQGHPNIVELKSITNINDSVIIMEYLDGMDLYTYVKERKQPVDENTLINWSKQIISALQYAHSRQIIHRDVKPSNIFLTKHGVIKVLDFGIAKVIQQTVDGRVDDTLLETITKTRTNLGAPQFMSPEQSCDPKLVTYLSDIYSFGRTLNYLAAGGNPTIKISPKLEKIIEKCTKYSLCDRFQSWEDVIISFDNGMMDDVDDPLNTSKLKIKPNLDCSFLMDDKKISIIRKGVIFSLKLNIGKYCLKFISTECDQDIVEQILVVEKSNIEYLIEVNLLFIREKRLESLDKQRKAEREKREAEEYRRKKEYNTRKKFIQDRISELTQKQEGYEKEEVYLDQTYNFYCEFVNSEETKISLWEKSGIGRKISLLTKDYRWWQNGLTNAEEFLKNGWDTCPVFFKEYMKNFLYIITFPIRFAFFIMHIIILIFLIPLYVVFYPFYLIFYAGGYKRKHLQIKYGYQTTKEEYQRKKEKHNNLIKSAIDRINSCKVELENLKKEYGYN